MIFLNFDAFWGTVTLTFDLEVIQTFQTWRSLTSICNPEMEAIMCTVSEKAERKKHLQTDGRTNIRTRDTRSEIDMMKILVIKEKKQLSNHSIRFTVQSILQSGHTYAMNVMKCL